jgi:hypothetical protein
LAQHFGTAGRRPNQGRCLLAAVEGARHNVTKPHQPQTYWDAGSEQASGAAGKNTRQAGASTSRRHWPGSRWPRMDQRKSAMSEQSCICQTGRVNLRHFLSIVTAGQLVQIIDYSSKYLIAAQASDQGVTTKRIQIFQFILMRLSNISSMGCALVCTKVCSWQCVQTPGGHFENCAQFV